MLDEDACEEAYLAIADMIDMRMPFTFGHSRAVASLAAAAAKQMGLPASDIRDVRRAAYTHDIGELTVPVSTWMRAGALTERETDEAHLHPYHGERALASLGGNGKAVASLVQRHHERLDGSGYYRNAKGPGSLARRPHPRRRGSISNRARSAASSAGDERLPPRQQNFAPRSRRESSALTPSKRCSRRPANPRAGLRPRGWQV